MIVYRKTVLIGQITVKFMYSEHLVVFGVLEKLDFLNSFFPKIIRQSFQLLHKVGRIGNRNSHTGIFFISFRKSPRKILPSLASCCEIRTAITASFSAKCFSALRTTSALLGAYPLATKPLIVSSSCGVNGTDSVLIKWISDEKMRGGSVSVWKRFGISADFFKCVGKSVGIARQQYAGSISQVLALARYGKT